MIAWYTAIKIFMCTLCIEIQFIDHVLIAIIVVAALNTITLLYNKYNYY